MKKLLLGTLVGLAIATSANASVVTLDYSKVTGAPGTVEFDTIDFPPFFPVSYYIDESDNGFVDNGEFVFDFGTDLRVGTLQLGATEQASIGATSGSSYSLVADYLLLGEAVVTHGESAELLQTNARSAGVSVAAYIDAVLQGTDGCTDVDMFSGPVCQAIADVQGETTLNGDNPKEVLAANLTDGIFNLFLADANGNRVGFAGSFGVTNTSLNLGTAVNLEVTGSLIQAEQGILFDQYGNSFADILADGNALPPTLTFNTTIEESGNLPGTLTSSQIGTNNEAGDANGEQLYYFTGAGYSASQVVKDANTCNGTNPDDISFGGCSNLIKNNGPADSLWDSLKNEIRTAAGCQNINNANSPCSLDLLARTTQLDGNAVIEATAPGTLLIGGLGLLMLGLRRKFF